MKSIFRITVAVLLFGGVLIGTLAYAYREKKPEWGDYISVRKIENEDQIKGSWALNGWTGYMGTALQLENGHFRYWFYSDVKTSDEPNYPITGSYELSGGKIVLGESLGLSERVWVFGSFEGREGLWQDSDLEFIIRRAESPAVRMLRKVSSSVDPKNPIYNTE